MSVTKRVLASGKIAYWVSFRWNRKQIWELAGSDKRAAERLDAQRKRELKAGTYMPTERRQSTTVGGYLTQWGERRKNRAADYDRRSLQIHVKPSTWFWEMALADVKGKHLVQLVGDLKALQARDGGLLAGKTLRNIYGLVSTALRDAKLAELTDVDPTLPRGMVSGARKRRVTAYDRADVARILECDRLTGGQRMFAALAYLTGAREGEFVGLRWRDLDTTTTPLWCLTIDHQYESAPLKTDEDEIVRPRRVPVHPRLQRMLEEWRTEGWRTEQLRAPTRDDRIVPRLDAQCHTKSTGYKAWRRILETAGVANLSLHATRHTFMTLLRRSSGRADIVEAITHNSAGKMIDQYNHWEWEPMCEVVQSATLPVYSPVYSLPAFSTNYAGLFAPAPGLEPVAGTESARKKAKSRRIATMKPPHFPVLSRACPRMLPRANISMLLVA